MNLISTTQLKEIDDLTQIILLDVREETEVANMPMKNMPVLHIPMGEVPSRLHEIDEDKHIIIFCMAGGRSARVCEYLISQGYSNVSNLVGGMLAWNA